MFHRRTTSIVLSVMSFFCAFHCLEAFAVYAFANPFGLTLITGKTHSVALVDQIFTSYSPVVGQFLLVPLCIALGIVLLLCSGRKLNPIHIAIWGSGVMLISIPNVVTVISQLVMEVSWLSRLYLASFYFYMFTAVAGILSFCVGIVSVLFASDLYRRLTGGAFVELPANAKQAEQNSMAEKPAKVKRSVVKKTQLVLERLWLAGLITEKEYYNKLKECADRLQPDASAPTPTNPS